VSAVFYYDFNSPYAYLAASRIDSLIPDARWRPMSFGIVVNQLGKVPWSFGDKRPEGVAEIARRARERGLPEPRYPEGWPVRSYSLAPLRTALFAEERGLLREFSREAFRVVFVEGRSLGDEDNLADASSAAGLDPHEVAEAIGRDEIKERLRVYTDEAVAAGVTGVPTVAVGDELFWGDDRLEEAAAAAASARQAAGERLVESARPGGAAGPR
jgi:2-hydroxychromene-2-carboxylate isomerase